MQKLDGSYRQPPSSPRYVCLSCDERAPYSGVCPRCGVERLPLGDARVRQELADAAERRLHARAGREQALLGAAAFLAAAPLRWLGGWWFGSLLWFAGGFIGTTLLWRVVARWTRRSALYEFRRRRAGSSEADHGEPINPLTSSVTNSCRASGLATAELQDEKVTPSTWRR